MWTTNITATHAINGVGFSELAHAQIRAQVNGPPTASVAMLSPSSNLACICARIEQISCSNYCYYLVR